MKQHLEYVATRNMTREEWLAYRQTGIGASEVGTIMGLDDYKSALQLFYEKTGELAILNTENLAMFMGREQEDFIANLWQHWGGDEQSMIQNYRDNRVIRRCHRVNAYVRNPRYPWLFVSLDRKINKHADKGEGTLELKTISGYEADKWEGGLPPRYVTQVQAQMLVCEFSYGEMAILQEGRKFFVLPFEINHEICEMIVEKTKVFWEKVEVGKKIVNKKLDAMRRYNQRQVDELTAELDAIAPEPDGTLAYAEFMNERFKNPHIEGWRKGTPDELLVAQNLKAIRDQLNALNKQRLTLENTLKFHMGNDQVLDFGLDGKVYWTMTKTGSRMFRNKVLTPGK